MMFKLRHLVLLLTSSVLLSGYFCHAARHRVYPTNAPVEYGNVVVRCKKSIYFERGEFTLNFDALRDTTPQRQFSSKYYTPPATYTYSGCPDSGVEEEVIWQDDPSSGMFFDYANISKGSVISESNYRAHIPTPPAVRQRDALIDHKPIANSDPSLAGRKVWEVSRIDMDIYMDGVAIMGTEINHFMAVVVEGNQPPLGSSFNGISRLLVSDINAGPGDVTQVNGLEWHHYTVTAKEYGGELCKHQDKTACDNIIRSDLYGTRIGNYTLFILGDYDFDGWNNLPAIESRRQLLKRWVDSFSVVKGTPPTLTQPISPLNPSNWNDPATWTQVPTPASGNPSAPASSPSTPGRP